MQVLINIGKHQGHDSVHNHLKLNVDVLFSDAQLVFQAIGVQLVCVCLGVQLCSRLLKRCLAQLSGAQVCSVVLKS